MKAKEYFDALPIGWHENVEANNYKSFTDLMYNTTVEFYKECQALVQLRAVKLDSALHNVFVEQHKKYKAFASLVNEKLGVELLTPYAFKNLLAHSNKESFHSFKDKLL